MKKTILGVKIDDINMNQALEVVHGWLSKPGKHYIVTTNPEFILTAQEDPEFKNILNKADLSIPDGRGLKLAADIVCNIPGVDLMERLIKMSADLGFTTGFLGGSDGVAEKTAECLQKKYNGLKVAYVSDGSSLAPSLPKTDLLFVAFGHPKQEKWIANNLSKIPVKVAMGVGGAFDYVSGKVPRAPKFLRNLGWEWLFRLIVQPWRIKRQIKLLRYLYLIMVH